MKITTSSLIWVLLGIVSIGGLIISAFGFSNFIYYFADACNIVLFIYALFKRNALKEVKGLTSLGWLLVLFILITAIGVLGNQVDPLLAVWGMRNIYRYILFFYSCIVLLDKGHVDLFFKVLPVVYWVQFIVLLIEYFVFGYKGDYLGGIFGVAKGCNGSIVIFLNISVAYFISSYLNGKISLWKLLLYTLMYFVEAALSETKGNYIFFVVLLFVGLIFSKKSFRSIAFFVMALGVLIVGLYLLEQFFPGTVDILLDINRANDYMNAEYVGYVIFTRNALLTTTNQYFFKSDLWLYLFGYGMGACDTSSFFSSSFYNQFGYMNYRQYSISMTLLQTGYLGLALYVAFFVLIAFIALKMRKETDNLPITVSLVCIFALIDSFYASLYIDAAYWLFFVLAIPFIIKKGQVTDENAIEEDFLLDRESLLENN